jgi:hypothetical protein
MEAALRLAPKHDPALLEQIPVDIRASNAPVRRECDPDKLAEPTRVVVALRLRVPKRFQDWIGLEDLALEKT